MPYRHLPVCPDLRQLKHQAKDLLRAIHDRDEDAMRDFREFHPDPVAPADAKLADAQLVLARSYYASSWTRLVQAVELVRAIWKDDIRTVRRLVTENPKLIHEDALIRPGSNWGPPMSYAANLGRDDIIRMLDRMGAKDHKHALGRATLQTQIGTARMVYEMLGKPVPPKDALGGPAYTLSSKAPPSSSSSATSGCMTTTARCSPPSKPSSRRTHGIPRPNMPSSRCT